MQTWIRKLVIACVMLVAPATARAEVAIGAFFGEPTGLDINLGLQRRTALDIVVGWYNHWDNWNSDGAYAHLTYMVTPLVASGRSVRVPLRLGIGGAVFDDAGRFNDNFHLAARVPFQVGLLFRRTPLEIYGEIAIKATFIDPNDTHGFIDLDGGIGIRFYF